MTMEVTQARSSMASIVGPQSIPAGFMPVVWLSVPIDHIKSRAIAGRGAAVVPLRAERRREWSVYRRVGDHMEFQRSINTDTRPMFPRSSSNSIPVHPFGPPIPHEKLHVMGPIPLQRLEPILEQSVSETKLQAKPRRPRRRVHIMPR